MRIHRSGEDAHPTASRHFLQDSYLGVLASRLEITEKATFIASERWPPNRENGSYHTRKQENSRGFES